jgi:hypothetical protein
MEIHAAGQKYGVDSDDGSQRFFVSLGRTVESLKGENSLKHDTAGDHYVRSEEFPDTAVSDVFYDQSRGSDSRTAAGHINLGLNYVRRDLPGCEPSHYPKQSPADPRSLRKDDVSSIAGKVNLSKAQHKGLHAVLMKYIDHLTTKPGKCNLMEYKFLVKSDRPVVSYSRPVPFAQRPAVHE